MLLIVNSSDVEVKVDITEVLDIMLVGVESVYDTDVTVLSALGNVVDSTLELRVVLNDVVV